MTHLTKIGAGSPNSPSSESKSGPSVFADVEPGGRAGRTGFHGDMNFAHILTPAESVRKIAGLATRMKRGPCVTLGTGYNPISTICTQPGIWLHSWVHSVSTRTAVRRRGGSVLETRGRQTVTYHNQGVSSNPENRRKAAGLRGWKCQESKSQDGGGVGICNFGGIYAWNQEYHGSA